MISLSQKCDMYLYIVYFIFNQCSSIIQKMLLKETDTIMCCECKPGALKTLHLPPYLIHTHHCFLSFGVTSWHLSCRPMLPCWLTVALSPSFSSCSREPPTPYLADSVWSSYTHAPTPLYSAMSASSKYRPACVCVCMPESRRPLKYAQQSHA